MKPADIVSIALVIGFALSSSPGAAHADAPRASRAIVDSSLVFEEKNGLVAVEAEHFFEQTLTAKRGWYVTTANATPEVEPDGDPSHIAGASGGAYLEALPDTRRSHGDRLIHGENFSNQPGKMAVLSYRVWFNTPGKYYVWARIYSTNTEDNGLHVGIDGTWPESGARMQWTAKRRWFWDSKQRTQEKHTGERYKLFLDVDKPGLHTIQFAMREDGIEFDRWLMTTDRDFARPEGHGPQTLVRAGELPPALRTVPAPKDDARPDPGPPLVSPRQPDGDGRVHVSGELATWHKVTITVDGPFAHERDRAPNPFVDYRMSVEFEHESGERSYVVPGYFAADGNAAESSADSGTRWRAHFAPDRAGAWAYRVSFVRGKNAALDRSIAGEPVAGCDGRTGNFAVQPSRKTGRDFRAHGRLTYVGQRYLRFAGSGEYFLKAGPDAPETFLAYRDFDGTESRKAPLKSWEPHSRDWRGGDPTWKDGKGKGIIGALNYLASEGLNAFSFLTYNAGGDGENVWPFVAPEAKLHYDCSKLDQWQILFDHAQSLGLYLHFKMQEQENDDRRKGKSSDGSVPAALDGGALGIERKLYCRELVARFGHALALNWNLGEENTQSPEEQRAMARYLREVDAYDHHIVVHTFPNQQDSVYEKLLGEQSVLTGASLQNHWNVAHARTLKWVLESEKAGRPWVCANDEQGPAQLGVPPDPGYEGKDGWAVEKDRRYNLHDIRKATLWGTLMAGGAGVEYYFGYKLPQNDLICEDFRSRDRSWDYCRYALEFFRRHRVPFHSMRNANRLIGNTNAGNSAYCFAKEGELYVVYASRATDAPRLDLSGATGRFSVAWFNPRSGGELQAGSVREVGAGSPVSLGSPPSDPDEDWVAVVRRS